jgi:predicted acyltransferase
MATLAAESPSTAPAITSAPSAPQRITSVDALRGFDMFWIMGADALAYALHRFKPSGPTTFIADQLEHAEWEGFHFYDLIFPLFVFLAGVSLVFSLSRTIERAGRGEALKRVFRRGILLFVIGIIYSGGFTNPWPDMRLMGVLNRIGLAYMFAGLFFCFFRPKALIGICAGLLIAYWAMMSFVPIRDIQLTKGNMITVAEQRGDTQALDALQNLGRGGNVSTNRAAWAASERLFYGTTNYVTGKFDKGHNLCNHLDFKYLPGKKYDNFFDPEGYLSTIPAVATCLLGVFAGFLLKRPGAVAELKRFAVAGGVVILILCLLNLYLHYHSFFAGGAMPIIGALLAAGLVAAVLRVSSRPGMDKVSILISIGITAALLGWLWDLQFPVNKKIWTSSYVLVAGGYSAILLGLFYWIVDVLEWRGWCKPFIWMGMNSITVYLASNLMGGGGWVKLGSRFAGGDIRNYLDHHIGRGLGEMTIAIVGLALAFWFCHFLYKRKIFLRL